TQRKYLDHVQQMFELLGEKPETAKADARTVMDIETALAKVSLTRVERRDPYKLFHKMSRAEFQKLTPEFDWDTYFKTDGVPATPSVNVTEPDFYKELERQLNSRSLAELKTYLRWHLAHARAR